MKSIALYFMAFQLLDFVTTFAGIRLGLATEMHPISHNNMITLYLAKIIVVIAGGIAFQRVVYKYRKIGWTIIYFSSFVVGWNGLNIMLALIYK